VIDGLILLHFREFFAYYEPLFCSLLYLTKFNPPSYVDGFRCLTCLPRQCIGRHVRRPFVLSASHSSSCASSMASLTSKTSPLQRRNKIFMLSRTSRPSALQGLLRPITASPADVQQASLGERASSALYPRALASERHR